METAEIGRQLIALLRTQDFIKAYNDLFSDDAESIDPLDPQAKTTTGLQQLIEKERQFLSKADILALEVSDAIYAGEYFSVALSMDFKINDINMCVDEICVYHVRQGKIISQQFFVSSTT
jgi:hypothetical protein